MCLVCTDIHHTFLLLRVGGIGSCQYRLDGRFRMFCPQGKSESRWESRRHKACGGACLPVARASLSPAHVGHGSTATASGSRCDSLLSAEGRTGGRDLMTKVCVCDKGQVLRAADLQETLRKTWLQHFLGSCGGPGNPLVWLEKLWSWWRPSVLPVTPTVRRE